MKHINRSAKFSDINYSLLPQNVDTNFVHAWADYLHWFPITWFESTLNRTELEACGTASFIGEIPKIIKARSQEIQWLHSHRYYYISFYIFGKLNVQGFLVWGNEAVEKARFRLFSES